MTTKWLETEVCGERNGLGDAGKNQWGPPPQNCSASSSPFCPAFTPKPRIKIKWLPSRELGVPQHHSTIPAPALISPRLLWASHIWLPSPPFISFCHHTDWKASLALLPAPGTRGEPGSMKACSCTYTFWASATPASKLYVCTYMFIYIHICIICIYNFVLWVSKTW